MHACSNGSIFSVPAPIVTIERCPDNSTQLYTTDSLELTCRVEIDAAVDTPIAVNTLWSGRESLSDSPHVSISNASRVPPYNSSISFSSSDTGRYVCTVQVTSDGNSNVIASPPTNQSIDISAGE